MNKSTLGTIYVVKITCVLISADIKTMCMVIIVIVSTVSFQMETKCQDARPLIFVLEDAATSADRTTQT